MPDFKLPDLGEGVTEAEIDRWLVEEGDEVAEDDLLVEVITDKATAEIPSPFAGKVERIHVKAGDVVPVGTVLITIGDGATAPTDRPAATPTELRVPPAPPTPPGPGPEFAVTSAAGRSEVVEPDRAVKAMPPVRKLARELDIDLSQVAGSGPDGRIERGDVEAYAGRQAETGATGVAPAPGAAAPGRREPLRGVRRVIAERMAEAHRVVPPVTHVEECDVTELDAARRLANERSPDQSRLTFLPFIVKAVVAGLKDYPVLNSSLDEEAGEIVYHDRYDIGIATDTPAGLVVPVVRDADNKSLREIAADIERLGTAAKDGTLSADELRGSTFTITSPGQYGGLMATPLVFYPQAAILGVHRATKRPVVRDDQIVARLMMNFSITFDHRILDGLTAARFVVDLVKLLEHPTVLALETD
jgi:pyruvate dehydrogenase E2 component (dihydrolipoamide acetyltransferase)